MKSASLFLLAALTALSFSAGCSSVEIGNSKDVNPETVYQQYLLSYTAGEPNFESLSQFRFAGEDGTTLVLSEPSTISFDDKIIKVDSNDLAGAYYGTSEPAGGFFGKHQFRFTDINLKTYKNEFTIDSIRLNYVPFTAYKSQPLQLVFDGITAGSNYVIEASTSDTDSTFTISYSSADKKSFLEIPASELIRQKGKELTLNFSVTQKIPLQNATREGGVILVTYDLKPLKLVLEENMPVSFSYN